MAELKMSDIFAESANRLPKEAKAKMLKVFMLLTSNPKHPSLQLKKIQGAHRDDIYECRVDQFWRLILQDLGNKLYQLVYVGAHDEAINRGEAVREEPTAYGPNSVECMVHSFAQGDDTSMQFVTVQLEELAQALDLPRDIDAIGRNE